MRHSPRFNENRLTLPRRPLRVTGGAVTALVIALLVGLVLGAILVAAADQQVTGPSRVDVAHLLWMTIVQASLTVVLSLLVGIALAWALDRLRFPGRDLVVALFASAIVTPGIVIAFGLLAVWGRSGWINQLWSSLFGAPLEIPLFGLGGILAAHVILDGAFAARILLARLDTIPDQRLKTGQSLNLTAWQRFLVIDWPTLRPSLPGLASIIFLLAFTSFPIVLLLGGGPANQTLEVAIYAAVRLEFDLKGAVILALVQIGFCGAIILSTAAFAPLPASPGPSRPPRWSDGPVARSVQSAILALCLLGFALPLVAILIDGMGPGIAPLLRRSSFWEALGTSLAIGSVSAALTLGVALLVGAGRAAAQPRLLQVGITAPAYAYLAVPAVVLSLGFFLLVRNLGLPLKTAAPPIVVLANALLALPFALATLAPPLEAIARRRGRLIRSLDLSGGRQFAMVEWPLIGRECGVVLALSFCFSLGDLGVISLFGTDDFTTLPLLMYRALGAYRTNDAAVIASLLLLLTIAAFVLVPAAFARIADAGR